MARLFYLLLLGGPIALAARLLGFSPLISFVGAALCVIPLAGLIGRSTEEVAVYTGPNIGGLLNATFGNAAELIIAFLALQKGLIPLVKAAIAGSIIGNVLLVMGLSMVAGGFKYGSQRFNSREAGRHANMMLMAVAGLLLPAAFGYFDHNAQPSAVQTDTLQEVSLLISVILLVLYVAYVVYGLVAERNLLTKGDESIPPEEPERTEAPEWSKTRAITILAAATIGTVFASELLVDAVGAVTDQLQWTQAFVGLIIVPLVGNAAENASAIRMALKNKMDLSMAIGAGASTQVALFVAPVLVLLSFPIGHPMDFVFDPMQIIVIVLATLLLVFVSQDGESNWLEGLELLGLYTLSGIVFFFLK